MNPLDPRMRGGHGGNARRRSVAALVFCFSLVLTACGQLLGNPEQAGGPLGNACGTCEPSGPVCGNDVVEVGETCDDGAQNGIPGKCNDTCAGIEPDACEPGCADHREPSGDDTSWETRCAWPACGACEPCNAAQCGDGVVEDGETCDDGPSNGQPGQCNETCNGTVPAACGSWCANHRGPDGNFTTWEKRCTWPACSACDPCVTGGPAPEPVCGNGVVEYGEVCDDGPLNGQPGQCNSTCSGIQDGVCESWCAMHRDSNGTLTPWEKRCTWETCGGCAQCDMAPQEFPNLIIILADDLGYQDVGFNGSTDIPTPHIDRIANGGVTFTAGYVSAPVCGPSRAGLLTGRYQNRFGFTTNPTVDPGTREAGIPFDEENIAEVLAKANYQSSIIGKWHMGSHPDQHPLNRGFDEFYGFLSGGHQYFPEELVLNDLSEVTRKYEWYRTRLMRDFVRVDTDQYLTDAFSDEAVRFIESQANKSSPFFLYLSYNAPHKPLQATEKYLSRFMHIDDANRRTYAAMVSAMDDGIGDVLDTLHKHNLTRDTLIVFLSDNGGPSNNASSNAPLRDWKGSMYEGGVRVPFAMQWAGKLPAGSVYEQPVISLDILGTIAALAGVRSANLLDGVNLIPYLTGEVSGAPHSALMWYRAPRERFAIRSADTKVVGRYAVAQEVFYLPTDISESDDIFGSLPSEEIEGMVGPWREWRSELKDQAFPTLQDHVWW